jgi:hypothetical protein
MIDPAKQAAVNEFALYVLDLMESEKDWGADGENMLDLFCQQSDRLGLSRRHRDGSFKSLI